MRGPNKRPRTAEHCAKIAVNLRRQWKANHADMAAKTRAAGLKRRVVFTSDMTATMFELFWRGRYLDVIAERIGVTPEVLRREVRRHGLPNRRHVPGFMRRGPYSRPTPSMAEIRARVSA